MADYSGANAPDYSQVLWDNGKPYYKTGNGGKMYIPPASAMSMFDDPKAIAWAKSQGYYIDGGRAGLNQTPTVGPDGKVVMPPNPVHTGNQSGGFLHTTGEWNSDTGQFDHSIDWGNILTLVVAGVMTAGVATAALGGGAGAEAAVSTAAATGSVDAGVAAGTAAAGGVGLGETAATIGGLSSAALPGTIAAPTIGGLAAAGGATTAAGGIGLGETGATTGLATGAGLPGATAIPTVGDLATTGSAIGGQAAGGADAATGGATSDLSKAGQLARALGSGIGGATQAAGQTQLSNAQLGLTANGQNNQLQEAIMNGGIAANNSNIQGQSSFEQELLARAKTEQSQRSGALANVYRANLAENPRVSPFNIAGAPVNSPAYLSTLEALSTQGQKKLQTGATYDTNNMPALAPYTPITPNIAPYKPYVPQTDPSTAQTIGNWLSPTLSTIGAIASIYGGR